MYKFRFENIQNTNQYEELIKVFLRQDQYEICEALPESSGEDKCAVFSFQRDKNALKRCIYECLRQETGKAPKWGILTGIRPVKLAGELYDATADAAKVRMILEQEYLLDPSKSALVLEILDYQRSELGLPQRNSTSLYMGIPFCPTRCLYCSFTSNQVKPPEIDRYLSALLRELEFCGRHIKEEGTSIESLYIGGGTPTTLNEAQMEAFLQKIGEWFDTGALKEYTVEAGRPDTITSGKLETMRKHGVERISINPQSMKEDTLRLIGRAHTVQETMQAFALARKAGMKWINADLIAGLPEETTGDFRDSVSRIIEMGAENITLHTLAVKRASRLKEMDASYHYGREAICEEMLQDAHEALRKAGYRPYYLYRQKHTSGNTENIGFCKEDAISVYNVRIMEEAQSILALGAGGISKVYYPEENRLERVANVSNYEIYIERIDEMIERKKNNFFGR